MPDQPPSQMIRVPTPLVDAVKELSRLHRAGRTKAVLEGVQRLVTAIDSEADVDIDSVTELISRLTERLERLEAQQADSNGAVDIDIVTKSISKLTERLEKVESDIEAIALTLQDLSLRMSDLEGVGDIDGYTTSPLAELAAEPPDQADISSDIEPTAKAVPPTPLTQSALAKRLGCSDKAVQKHRQQDTKQQFAAWSRARDPDGVSWTWEGEGGRGQPLQFVPLD